MRKEPARSQDRVISRAWRVACTGWLSRRFLASVLLVGIVAMAAPGPGRALDNAGVIDPTLAVLVFTTGLSISASDLGGLRRRWRRIALVVVASTTMLPVLAWAASRMVVGPSRDGILTLGVAPAEVASVALAELASGDVLVSVSILVASVLLTVVAAGPILSLLGAHSHLQASGLLVVLALIVGAPLVLGAGVRFAATKRRHHDRTNVTTPGAVLGSVALLILLWEVASEVQLRAVRGSLVLALAVFMVGTALMGWLLGQRLDTTMRRAILLPVAMRDFAVAAGIATTAFGPASTGALGIYGVAVLLAGTAYATLAARAVLPPP